LRRVGVDGLNASGDGGFQFAERGVTGEGALRELGEAAGEEEAGIGTAIFEGGDAGGEAVAELVVELGFHGGIGERGDETFHGGQLFIEAAEYRGAIDEGEREAIGVGAGDEDEKELGRDQFADFGFLGLERLDGEAGLGGGGIDGQLWGRNRRGG
jgi:hypothetical protein